MDSGVGKLKAQFAEYVSQNLEEPNSLFEKEEIESLTKQMNALQKGFEDLLAQHKITEEELDAVKQELDSVKQELNVFPKAAWYHSAFRTLFNFLTKIATSKEGKELATHTVKSLITGDSGPTE